MIPDTTSGGASPLATQDLPYLQAGAYWRAGFANPIPVIGKGNPVPGYTGKDGLNVSWPDLQAWTEDEHAAWNIAIRHTGTVGIDVDGADGADTLVKAEEELGPLPATWSVTSRGPNQPRRTHIYRVPGVVDMSRAEGRFRKQFGPLVDIIHRGHRYSIVPPSIHPETGDTYRWYDPSGRAYDTVIPSLVELAELPAAWVEFLRARDVTPEPGVENPFEAGGRDRTFTQAEAVEYVRTEGLLPLAAAPNGDINNKLRDAALIGSHFGPDFWARETYERELYAALRKTVYDGKTWTAQATIDRAYQDNAAKHADDPTTYWFATLKPAEPDPVTTLRDRMRARLYDRDRLDEIRPPTSLIADGVLDVATISMLAGKFGTYKSFISVAWACSIATGVAWFDHEITTTGPILYVAAEGASGIRQRVRAWEVANLGGERIPARDLMVYNGRVKLTNPAEVEIFLEIADEIRPRLIVFDTLHKMTAGLDEQSNQEMAGPLDVAATIVEDVGAGILLDHHTGHSGERSRGASALEDDIDTSWVIKLANDTEDRSPANQRVLTHRKAKDRELVEEIPLVLRTIEDSAVVDADSLVIASDPNWLVASTIAMKLDDAGVPRGLTVRDTKDAGAAIKDINRHGNLTWTTVARLRKGPASSYERGMHVT